MSAGLIIPSLTAIASSESEALIFGNFSNTDALSLNIGPWTPPQYSRPAVTVLSTSAVIDQTSGEVVSSAINYVFDAVFNILHERTIKKTSHPVLTGPNMSDHAYLEPARVSLEIGMSDAMSSFSNGVWVGASTKSISAWQIIKSLEQNKTLLTLTTRLDTYSNMLILSAKAPDNLKTGHALRATIVLEELIAGIVYSNQAQSAVPQTSGNTNLGTVQSTPPNSSLVQQHVIPSDQYPDVQTYGQIPGAGDVSSNSLSKYNVNTGTSEGVP